MKPTSRIALILLALVGFSYAQDAAIALEGEAHEGKSADEIARELANPNNSLASLTFKNQYRFYDGNIPGSASQDNYTMLFQPVFPFSLESTSSGGKANLFVRPAFPLLFEQPVFDPATGSWDGVTALGDIGFDIGYGVTESNGVFWALGMVGTLPTATDSRIGGGQLRLGPGYGRKSFRDQEVDRFRSISRSPHSSLGSFHEPYRGSCRLLLKTRQPQR